MRIYFKTISKILLACLILPLNSLAQTGGQFAITQSVIAGGGAVSSGGNFGVIGTTAQANAGIDSGGGQFSVKSGFWQSSFAPTAAQVSVAGRVLTANGAGIRNARVTITDQNGQMQTAYTGSFGYFRFTEVLVGEIYILTVHSKRFTFGNPTRVLSVLEETGDIEFIADPQD
jgi:Carboxypeptidase regulatory-like domain